MKVTLHSITPDPEATLIEVARVSSSRDNKREDYGKLINYLIRNYHLSPFEHASLTLEIETSKAIAIQLLRHRSFSFQELCISGDSLISCQLPSGKIKRRSIEELYTLQHDKRWSRLVRVWDEERGELCTAKVKEVFDTGIKEVYRIVLENGKEVKATLDHKFLTKDGFKELRNISIGDSVACNGIPVYQSKEWMENAKLESIMDGTGVQGIADKAGVSYHTIRKWLKKLGLQFTKKEVALYTEVWNKGLPKEQQPGFGYVRNEETRNKMRESSRKGRDSNLYIDGRSNDRTFRQKVWDWQTKYKKQLEIEQGGCRTCGSTNDLEIDHIIPISQNPEKAFDYDNLQLLCYDCHKKKSSREYKQTVWWSAVKSIEYVGEEQTYDMEIDHLSHNYVANGIVTHNSQRYQNVGKMYNDIFEPIELRKQAENNRQSSTEVFDPVVLVGFETDEYGEEYNVEKKASLAIADVLDQIENLYNSLLREGVSRETARFILPMCTKTTLYMTGTIRSWLTFLNVRLDEHAQKEIRDIAVEVGKILEEHLPYTTEATDRFNNYKGMFFK